MDVKLQFLNRYLSLRYMHKKYKCKDKEIVCVVVEAR